MGAEVEDGIDARQAADAAAIEREGVSGNAEAIGIEVIRLDRVPERPEVHRRRVLVRGGLPYCVANGQGQARSAGDADLLAETQSYGDLLADAVRIPLDRRVVEDDGGDGRPTDRRIRGARPVRQNRVQAGAKLVDVLGLERCLTADDGIVRPGACWGLRVNWRSPEPESAAIATEIRTQDAADPPLHTRESNDSMRDDRGLLVRHPAVSVALTLIECQPPAGAAAYSEAIEKPCSM